MIARAALSAIVFVTALEIGLRLYNPFPFRVHGDRIVLPVYGLHWRRDLPPPRAAPSPGEVT